MPEALKSDGGRQFTATAVEEALREWHVRQEVSAPHLPRTNGRAEVAVKMLKKLIAGATEDGQTQPNPRRMAEGLLALRNMGVEGGPSPAVLAFGRPLRKPLIRADLGPPTEEATEKRLRQAEQAREAKRAAYDAHTRPLKPLRVGQAVWIQNPKVNGDPKSLRWTTEGVIVATRPHHEYVVQKDQGRETVTRARVHLKERRLDQDPLEQEQPAETEGPRRSTRDRRPRVQMDL
jgi:hypothetical protein